MYNDFLKHDFVGLLKKKIKKYKTKKFCAVLAAKCITIYNCVSVLLFRPFKIIYGEENRKFRIDIYDLMVAIEFDCFRSTDKTQKKKKKKKNEIF